MLWFGIILVTVCFLTSLLSARQILARPNGLGMDPPDGFRKQHPHPISRLGGLPVMLGLVVATALISWREPEFFLKWRALLLCNVLMFGVGFIDDLKPLGAKVKLAGQVGVALTAWFLGLGVDKLSLPFFGNTVIDLGGLSLPITVLWLVALPNLVNLIDGMDGLAGGIGVFLCFTLSFVGYYSGHPEVVWLGMGGMASIAGFLRYNFPPARIFLGDGGAYLIGFFIGSVSLMSSNKGSIAAAMLVILVAFGLPILDTFFAIVRRAVRGLPVFRGDYEHIHHQMLRLGFSKSAALLSLYAVCVVLSIVGISVFWSRGLTLPIMGGAFFICALLAARYLGYIRHWSQLRAQLRQALKRRADMQYAIHLGELLELELDRCTEASAYWQRFHECLGWLGFTMKKPREDAAVYAYHLGNGEYWTVFPLLEGKDEELKRLAECLQSAYATALHKWGKDEGPRSQV